MKYYLAIVIAALLFNMPSFAQPHSGGGQDSMLALLPRAAEDSNKVKLLFAIGQTYANEKPEQALDYLQRSEALSEKLKYDAGAFHAMFAIAPLLGRMNRLDDCIAVGEKVLGLAKKTNNQTAIATSYYDIAGGYQQKGQFEKALNYFLETEKALQGTTDTVRQCIICSSISHCYSTLSQYDKAYAYGMKGIRLAVAIHSDQALSTCLLTTADVLGGMNRYDTALLLYSQAKEIYRRHGDDYYIISILVNSNHILKEMGRYNELLVNADTILALSEKVHRMEGMCEGYIQKGTYYFYKKDFALADKYAKQALEIALKRDHPQTLDECYSLLSDIALGAGDMKAYANYKNIDDSIHNMLISDNIVRNTQELETKYNVAEKENKIQLQQASLERKRLENTILIIALLLISVALVMGFVVYNNKRRLLLSDKALQQQKIETLETERQLLATRSVVQGQEEERSRLAKDLHDGLGGILSGAKYALSNMKENLIITPENAIAFERTMNMLDLSISEMRRVAHNMMPESLMKLHLDEALLDYCEQVTASGAIAIDYQSTDMDKVTLNDTHKITVYRIVQELVNNILKHAAATNVIVQVFAKNHVLYVTVEDNGKGFDKDQLMFSQGIGYRNIKNRIDYLEGKLDIQSAPGKGTAVYIEIPVQ